MTVSLRCGGQWLDRTPSVHPDHVLALGHGTAIDNRTGVGNAERLNVLDDARWRAGEREALDVERNRHQVGSLAVEQVPRWRVMWLKTAIENEHMLLSCLQ